MTAFRDIQIYDELPSTQAELKALAEAGAREGCVVQAKSQTKGQGRHGRAWISPLGNLYISLLLRPGCKVHDIGQLSLLSGVALAKTILSFIGSAGSVTLKWPNDVLLNGKKCSGLLLETGLADGQTVEYVLLGVGVNVISAPEEGACIKDYTEVAPTIEVLRNRFLSLLEEFYEAWKQEGFEKISAEWLALAHNPGDPVSVKIGSRIESGSFYGIDGQGSLLISNGAGQVRKVTAGDVFI